MKKTLLLAAMMLFIGTQESKSADRRNFWLLNNTGYKITNVYISAHGTSNSWGTDVLGSGTLYSGGGTVVFFSGPVDSCWYDFRIGYSDGSHQDYTQGRNLCSAHAIQFNVDTNDQF